MDLSWVEARPHLKLLLERVQALLELADEAHAEGQRGAGESVDYGVFEERVAKAGRSHQNAESGQEHESSLDLSVQSHHFPQNSPAVLYSPSRTAFNLGSSATRATRHASGFS